MFLIALTMCAFAANSVLNRLGVARFGTDPMTFAAIRVTAGAATLVALVWLRGHTLPPLWIWARAGGAISLAIYLIGFSLAYATLDTGLGALILFGGVQLTMFAWSLASGTVIPARRSIGAGVALTGLAVLVWPTGAVRADLTGATLMAAAAFGWGCYSMLGARVSDPLGATAANFLLALPLLALAALWHFTLPSVTGVALAIVSGAVTSGLGYALWYRVLASIDTSIAAVAQLSVPIIAALGGVVVLGEDFTWRFAIATALVLGGILISLRREP